MLPEKSSYVIRFAGDSGDGIQLQGAQFTMASALAGHDPAPLLLSLYSILCYI